MAKSQNEKKDKLGESYYARKTRAKNHFLSQPGNTWTKWVEAREAGRIRI